MPEDRLDEALNQIRKESVPAEELAAAKARVWEKLAGTSSPACAEFRPALPAYLAGELEFGRRLLLEDHLSRCPSCRKAWVELRGERKVAVMPAPRRPRAFPRWAKWAVAASLAALAVYLGSGPADRALAPSGPRATLVAASGEVDRVPQGRIPLGAAINEGEILRTAMGARALLRLADGSLVEVNERTELAFESTFTRRTIRLNRGDIIVQAAPQRFGRLQVWTRDSVASVKGTVFAVSSGLAGSLVSVIEGAVQVRQPRGQRLLRRGQAAASTPALDGISVERTIAWSENAEKYYALLGELAAIEKSVAATHSPAVRTQSSLLPYLPAGSLVYVALPNLGPAIGQTVALIEQRAAQSAVLREWWTSQQTLQLKEFVDKLQTVSPLVGDEVVFVLFRLPLSKDTAPVLLAAVQPGQQAALEQALAQLAPDGKLASQIRDTLLVVSDSPANLSAALAALGSGAAGPFAAEIASHYRQGVSGLAAFDVSASRPSAASPAADATGFSHLKYVVLEQRGAPGSEELRAAMVFDGPRTGVASWLAGPGPAGSAEYVSADAVLAVSASTRDPREAYDEFNALIGRLDPKFREGLAEMEAHTGISVDGDIASALGSDFTFAIERPSLPVPGWIAAIEVKQPASIDAAARRFADSVNQQLASAGKPPAFQLAEETAGGRSWMRLTFTANGLPLYWTYDRGYMILSTDRDLAAQAIATRNGGFPLIRSQKFQAQLPAASGPHQSAFLWLNTQGALADAAALMNDGALKSLLANRDPLLIVSTAETERIQAAGRTRFMDLVFTAMLSSSPARHPGVERRAQANAARNRTR